MYALELNCLVRTSLRDIFMDQLNQVDSLVLEQC